MQIRLLTVFLVALSLSGCATIIEGQTQNVSVSSKVIDSSIYINGNYIGTGSISADLRKKDRHVISVIKNGCRDGTKEIQKEISKLTLLTAFCLICFGTDIASGAAWKFTENIFEVNPSCKT